MCFFHISETYVVAVTHGSFSSRWKTWFSSDPSRSSVSVRSPVSVRFFGGPGFRRPERNMGEKILVNYWRFLPLRISESGLIHGIGWNWIIYKDIKNKQFFFKWSHSIHRKVYQIYQKKDASRLPQMFQKQYFLWPGNQGLIFCFPSRTCCMNLPLKWPESRVGKKMRWTRWWSWWQKRPCKWPSDQVPRFVR